MRSYFDALLRYFEFSGRTGRAQYWIYQLVALLVTGGVLFIEFKLNGKLPSPDDMASLFTVVALFHAIPGITITVRRLHDIGRSGWWYLLNFIPVAGLIILVWTCCASEDGANDYGDPNDFAARPASKSTATGPRWDAAKGRPLASVQTRNRQPTEGRFI